MLQYRERSGNNLNNTVTRETLKNHLNLYDDTQNDLIDDLLESAHRFTKGFLATTSSDVDAGGYTGDYFIQTFDINEETNRYPLTARPLFSILTNESDTESPENYISEIDFQVQIMEADGTERILNNNNVFYDFTSNEVELSGDNIYNNACEEEPIHIVMNIKERPQASEGFYNSMDNPLFQLAVLMWATKEYNTIQATSTEYNNEFGEVYYRLTRQLFDYTI